MKGVIFNAIEETVRSEQGEDAWDDLLDAAGLTGAYTSLGTYPDEQVYALVDAASSALSLSKEDLLRHLGRRSFGYLAARSPELMTGFRDSRTVLLSLNAVIHPEVRKIYPGADVPVFEVATETGGQLSLSYQSKRGLCHYAEGLAHGAADHFGETLEVSQPRCQHRGAPDCELLITWADPSR
jgi:hypothetical protein